MARHDGGADASAAFAGALADLKRRGSLLLVAGGSRESTNAACDRLLGDDSAASRRRLRVTVGDAPSATADGGPPMHRVHYHASTRSAASAAPDGPAANVTTVDGGLGELATAITREVDTIADAAGGLEPAELRVCLDDVDALLAAHDEESVFGFLHGIGSRVRAQNGMGHAHLPVPTDDAAVQTFTPLFDAVIEVRDGDPPQQRWHLRDADITTDWLAL